MVDIPLTLTQLDKIYFRCIIFVIKTVHSTKGHPVKKGNTNAQYIPRNDKTLTMFKAQPVILRDPKSKREDRVQAFYLLLTMEWVTNKAITFVDLDITSDEVNQLSIKFNSEFMEGKQIFCTELMKSESAAA
jgi:hypothetical protein